MNFALYVEGHTEARALPLFLKRLVHGLSRPVTVKPVNLQGSGNYLKIFAEQLRKTSRLAG